MRRRNRAQNSASLSATTSSATDTEWSDLEDRSVRHAVLFQKKVDEGAAACAHGDFTRALQLYDEAIRLDPTNHVLFTNRSAIFCKLARYEEALADAEKSYSLNSGWTKAFYRKGYALKLMGKHIPALIAFASGLVQDSKNCQLLAGLIECMSQSDMKDRFTHVYKELKYLGLENSPFVIVSVVGQEILSCGHTMDAISILECALRIGTTSQKLRQSVLSALSTAYYNIGDWTKAQQLMEEDLSIAVSLGDSASEARAQGNLGMLSLAVNKLDDALAHYHRQMKILSQMDVKFQSASTMSTIGQIYRRQFRYDESLSMHEQCLDMIQDQYRTDDHHSVSPVSLLQCQQYGYIGDLHLALGRFEEAEKYFLDHLDHARCVGSITEEIKALTELGAVDHSTSRWDDSVKRYSAALSLSNEEKNRSTEASLCCNLSSVYEAKGRLDVAKQWADRALALALSLQDHYNESKACGHLANVEMKMGMRENAKRLYNRQLDTATKLDDAALMMKAYRGLGLCCSSSQDGLTDAVRYHQKELAMTQQLDDKVSECASHGHLGHVFTKIGNYQSAGRHFSYQLTLAKEIKRSKLEMAATKNLGFHYASGTSGEEGNLELAVDYFEKYLMLAQENNDVDAEHIACTNLGRTHFRLGHYKESARYYDQALSLAKDMRDHVAMAKAYCDLGNVRLAMNELDEALECQKYFLALAHILNDTESKLTALSNIGDVLRKSGKGNVAAKVFAKQLSLAKSSRRKKYEALAYGKLGETYDQMGKNEKAMALFLQELALYEEINDQDGQFDAHGRISNHYQIQGRIELALNALRKQLQLCQRLGQFTKEADIYKRMGELCASENLLNEAVHYFDQRRSILLKRSSRTVAAEGPNELDERASLDYARCLLSVGDDIGAVGALDDVLQSIHSTESYLTIPEIGSLYRDQGWCWMRLRNYGKAVQAFQTALDYLDTCVVDAGMKCDCYRAIAAAEFEMGNSESALNHLNQRLEFLRAVGYSVEEPKALCDLAYVLFREGDYAKAEAIVRTAIELTDGNSEDMQLAFRTRILLAMIRDYMWNLVEEFALEYGGDDCMITALVLKAGSIMSSSPAAAGQSLDRALSMINESRDHRLAPYAMVLSALRHWSASNTKVCKDEFMEALQLLETTDTTRNTSLFDEDFIHICNDLCLTLSFVFFASHKMDNEALVTAERLRYRQLRQCLRTCGIRYDMDEKTVFEQSLTSRLKTELQELKRTVLYFVQVEDILFSWILSASFQMSSSHRVPLDTDQHCNDVPLLLSTLRLRWPFHHSLTELVKKLVIQTCFNGQDGTVSQPSCIMDQAIQTAVAHDNVAPIVIGCGHVVGYPSHSGTTMAYVPIHQLSFSRFIPTKENIEIGGEGLLINGSSRSFNLDGFEVVDPGNISRACLLSKFRHRYWIHFMAECSKERAAIALTPYALENDNDDGLLLTMEDVLTLRLGAHVVTIGLQGESNSTTWNQMVNLASAFLVSGVGTVIMARNCPESFFQRFYTAMNDGIGIHESLTAAMEQSSAGNELELFVISRGDGGPKTQPSTRSQASVSLTMLLETPEECREALRVILHLIEKALQRINVGLSNPMFTSEQSVRNKAGPEVRGCIEFLLSVGFERGVAKGSHLPSNDALYFPLNDPNGILASGSVVIQALLGLPQTALFAFSKMASADNQHGVDVLHLVENLDRELTTCVSTQLECNVSKAVWEVPGLPSLLAALGFDKMSEKDDVYVVKTIRMELTRKKVALALTAIRAIFGGIPSTSPRGHYSPSTIHTISRRVSSSKPVNGRRSSCRKLRRDNSESAGNLSGLESDFSAADLPLMSMVSLVKRGRNDSTGNGSGIGKKRGRRGFGQRLNSGGYLSEGEIGKRDSKPVTGNGSRGYCSEDDRDVKVYSETSMTAHVISVDEQCSPVFTEEEYPIAHWHEYARLETPAPSSINDHSLPSTYPCPVPKLPPPYHSIYPLYNTPVNCGLSDQTTELDLTAPSEMRKAMEKLAAAGIHKSPPPAYGYAVKWQNGIPSTPQVPLAYGRSASGSARKLAGY